MRMLLLSKRFKYMVNLEPIEVKSNAPNEDIISAVDSTELHDQPHR